MRIFYLSIFVLVLLTAGSAFAGGKEAAPYRCVVDGKKVEDCMLGCKTKEICAKEEEALKALAEAESITFYTLEGSGELALPREGQSLIHGKVILGQLDIEGRLAKDIANVFDSSIVNQISLGACFEPRHALTIKTQHHTYDYLLCFECSGLALYRDGQHISTLGTHRDYSELNALAVKAGLPLSPYYLEEGK